MVEYIDYLIKNYSKELKDQPDQKDPYNETLN